MNQSPPRYIQTIFLLIFLCIMQTVHASPAENAFNKLADEYFDTIYLPAHPTKAISLGEHQYDNNLEDYARSAIQDLIIRLKKFGKRVEAFDPAKLDLRTQGDRELILNDIHSQLLTLEAIRPHEKNPDYYSSTIASAVFVLMSRHFAPPEQRLRSLIAREKLMPEMLAKARKNLKNPPKIFTEIAIEQLPGIISFFQNDLPLAFANVKDASLKADFLSSNTTVITALQSYQSWLKSYLLPRSGGDFRIGASNFRKKLQYDEMLDLPLAKLLAIGRTNLRENQLAYKKISAELAKSDLTKAADKSKQTDHPAPADLLTTFSASFDSLIQFIRQKNIVGIPSDIRPIMEETPPFMRAMTIASMDTPGAFESVAKEAYFNVTLPKAEWSQAKINEYMGLFSYPAIKIVSIHETYPGHYLQFLWMHQVPGRVRKILGAYTNAEGWAHYTEQMMLDAGYGSTEGERKMKELRLRQLQYALLRNARFIVGIEMHTGKMSMKQAIDFFVNQGYQSRTTAIIEMKRGTSDPTYLYYTLGKLQILKLRKDLAAKEGKNFRLQKFHDDFMRQGYPPIKIVRRALMHDDSPVL